MSKRRNYTSETLAIMQRFYEALDLCIETGLLKNISRFCDDYTIDKRHLYAQRKDLNKGLFQVSWLLPLVEDCLVSPMWLLTGKGKMFTPKRRAAEDMNTTQITDAESHDSASSINV